MNCRQIQHRLYEYLDGELSHSDRFAVDAHLSGCDGCRAECEARRRLSRVVADTPGRPLSAGFDAALQARLREVEALRARRPGWQSVWASLRPGVVRDWRPLVAPVAIAAVAVALMRPTPPPTAPPVSVRAETGTYLARVVVEHLETSPSDLPAEDEAVDEALRANSVGSLIQ